MAPHDNWDDPESIALLKKVLPEKPSPIDNLPHSSVWGKLRDLEARVERLERKVGLRSD